MELPVFIFAGPGEVVDGLLAVPDDMKALAEARFIEGAADQQHVVGIVLSEENMFIDKHARIMELVTQRYRSADAGDIGWLPEGKRTNQCRGVDEEACSRLADGIGEGFCYVQVWK